MTDYEYCSLCKSDLTQEDKDPARIKTVMPEEREKIVDLIEEGNVGFQNPNSQEALANMNFQEPDYTITGVRCAAGGMTIQWETKSAGFGETSLYMENGKLCCDDEDMGRDFVKEVLLNLLDSMTLTSEQ